MTKHSDHSDAILAAGCQRCAGRGSEDCGELCLACGNARLRMQTRRIDRLAVEYAAAKYGARCASEVSEAELREAA